MPKAKPKTEQDEPAANNAMTVPKEDAESAALATARAILAPDFRHGMAVAQLHSKGLGKTAFAPGMGDYADALKETGDKAAKGELAFVSRMLATQAITLDNMFAELARRMSMNMSEYLGATETYARIALKAQANSRATLEALAKLHQPREQTVRHVHVNEGGQAVIADQFHHHPGSQENGKPDEQPQATGAVSAGAGTALPSSDPLGISLPIPRRERKPAMQNARRKG
jgi:hypothetical protein